MWKNFVSKKILLILIAVFLLTLASLSYLKVAYGYEFDESENVDEGWSFDAEDYKTDENENIFDGKIMGTVSMSHKFLDGDILKISVHAGDMVMPILGLAFHLNYDGEKIKFLKYDPGEFLERGGDPFYLVQNDEQNNKIVFGETLRRNDNFPFGEGPVADFYFQIFKKDAMDFEFINGVVSTLDVVRQDIDEIVWENLRLDKNGKKAVIDTKNNPENSGLNNEIEVNTAADGLKLPENFATILIMGIIIAGLGVWIFVDRKRRNKRPMHYVNFK